MEFAMDIPQPLPGIFSRFVETPRLTQHVLISRAADGVPVIFLHGNFSAALYFEELMLALPAGFRGIAPDMRGYGWAKGKLIDATPCYRHRGGGGVVNQDFVARITKQDRSADDPNSPRNIINTFYYAAPFRAAREEDFLAAALMVKTGIDRYPGDATTSANWPMVAPGVFGPVNAWSLKYHRNDVDDLIKADQKPPVLWIRGSHDLIVADNSMFDIAALGKLGYVPGWPGDEGAPPQPMIHT